MLVDEIILSCKLKLTESALGKKKKVVLHSTLLVEQIRLTIIKYLSNFFPPPPPPCFCLVTTKTPLRLCAAQIHVLR